MVADQFLHGTISRVSREAPVFILHHDKTDTRAGGAANAAANVASLGGKPMLVGFIGNDANGALLKRRLDVIERRLRIRRLRQAVCKRRQGPRARRPGVRTAPAGDPDRLRKP